MPPKIFLKRLRGRVRLELWIAIAAGLTLIATLMVVFQALNSLAAEVDRNDRQHFKTATHAAVQAFERRLRENNQDYSMWDDAFQAIYGTPNLEFIDSNFRNPTETRTIFDTAFIRDENGNDIAGYVNGVAEPMPSTEFFGKALLPFFTENRDAANEFAITSGIARTPLGIAAVAAGPVMPFTKGTEIPKGQRRVLIIAKHLTGETLKRMSEDFLIAGLKFTDQPVERDTSLVLTNPVGKPLATLTWTVPKAGSKAYSEIASTVYFFLSLLSAMVMAVIAIVWVTLRSTRVSQGDAEHAALHDSLTRLPNRTALLAMATNVAAGLDMEDDIAVAFLDLDGFKEVNDTHGHAAGDRALRGCAAGFSHICAGKGLLARMGGDEFAFLALGCDARKVATEVARSFIALLEIPIRTPEGELQLGTSVGIAAGNSGEVMIQELLRRSDIAMYEAKRLGGNRIAYYDAEIDAKLQERASLIAQLRDALGRGEISVKYQLIVDAASHRPCAIEVLARWTLQDRREIPPDIFIPLAEQSGLITEIGAFVLRQACLDTTKWPGLMLCVNVSPVQFHHPGFSAVVESVLAETGFPPDRLELEFTERHLLSEPEDALATMNALRQRGIAIALDDFGTGYSSIGYLRRFPFDRLKLDRSICADITRDVNVQSLIQGTIAIARSMRLKVTAEGVEDEYQARFLRLAGCDLLQGYFFAEPVAAGALTERLAAYAPAAPARLRRRAAR